MIIVVAAQALSALVTPQQTAVLAYQECLTPIVRANELVSKDNYQPLEIVLGRIKSQCAKERAAAGEALAFAVTAYHPDRPRQPTDAEKEELTHDATIRWANDVVARIVAGSPVTVGKPSALSASARWEWRQCTRQSTDRHLRARALSIEYGGVAQRAFLECAELMKNVARTQSTDDIQRLEEEQRQLIKLDVEMFYFDQMTGQI